MQIKNLVFTGAMAAILTSAAFGAGSVRAGSVRTSGDSATSRAALMKSNSNLSKKLTTVAQTKGGGTVIGQNNKEIIKPLPVSNTDLTALERRIDELDLHLNDTARDLGSNISENTDNIRIISENYVGKSDGYTSSDEGKVWAVQRNGNNYKLQLIDLPVSAGQAGMDGLSVFVRVNNNYIQTCNGYSLSGCTEWMNLISLNDLRGEPGRDGLDGCSPQISMHSTEYGSIMTVQDRTRDLATASCVASGLPYEMLIPGTIDSQPASSQDFQLGMANGVWARLDTYGTESGDDYLRLSKQPDGRVKIGINPNKIAYMVDPGNSIEFSSLVTVAALDNYVYNYAVPRRYYTQSDVDKVWAVKKNGNTYELQLVTLPSGGMDETALADYLMANHYITKTDLAGAGYATIDALAGKQDKATANYQVSKSDGTWQSLASSVTPNGENGVTSQGIYNWGNNNFQPKGAYLTAQSLEGYATQTWVNTALGDYLRKSGYSSGQNGRVLKVVNGELQLGTVDAATQEYVSQLENTVSTLQSTVGSMASTIQSLTQRIEALENANN